MKAAPPKLVLNCKPPRIPLGNETRCAATLENGSGTSFIVQSWRYSGTTVPTAPTGDVKVWTFTPGEIASGTVTVTALIGGVSQTATATVEVVCNFFRQPTGDSILDRADVQDHLRELWTQSNPNDPGPGRIEKGMMITQQQGKLEFHPFLGPSTRCTSGAGPMTLSAIEIVAMVHTHPDPPGAPWPSDCEPQDEGTNIKDGPSRRDTRSQRRLSETTGTKIPSYIVELNHVHRHGRGIAPLNKRRNHTC